MKTPFKLTAKIILFFLITLFYTCEKEENSITQDLNQDNTLPYITSKKNFEEISQNSNLITQLNNILNETDTSTGNSSASKIVFIPNYSFYVDTADSNYLENISGSYHSYTFPIYRINDHNNNVVQNLFFSYNSSNDNYDTFIVSYDLTVSERESLSNNIHIDLTNKVTLEYLSDFDTDVVLNSLVLYVDTESGNVTCWEENFGTSQGTGWTVLEYEEVICPWLIQNPNYGSGDSSSGSNIPLDYQGNISTWNPNGNNSSSGGNGGNNTISNNNPSSSTYIKSIEFERRMIFREVQLTPEQNEQFDTLSLETQNILFDYLDSNLVSDEINSEAYEYPQSAVGFVIDLLAINDEDTINEVLQFLDENPDEEEFISWAIHVLVANPEANPLLFADCRSFEYAQPPGALQKGCAVTNFNHTFYYISAGPILYAEIESIVPIAYFTMPSGMTNGQAANLTAIAVTAAVKATDVYFASNPNISTIALGQYFKNRLNLALSSVGGNVNTNTPPFPIPSPAPYIQSILGISNPYDCN